MKNTVNHLLHIFIYLNSPFWLFIRPYLSQLHPHYNRTKKNSVQKRVLLFLYAVFAFIQRILISKVTSDPFLCHSDYFRVAVISLNYGFFMIFIFVFGILNIHIILLIFFSLSNGLFTVGSGDTFFCTFSPHFFQMTRFYVHNIFYHIPEQLLSHTAQLHLLEHSQNIMLGHSFASQQILPGLFKNRGRSLFVVGFFDYFLFVQSTTRKN